MRYRCSGIADDMHTRIPPTLSLCVLCMLLIGCGMEDRKPQVSDDIAALRDVVDIPVDLKSARWEIFGTPEYTGGVPGPTDYITLVAELELAPASADFAAEADRDHAYVVPEAARPWISDKLRSILEQGTNATLDLAPTKTCHAYTARLKKSGRPVDSFICTQGGRTVLYLPLLE